MNEFCRIQKKKCHRRAISINTRGISGGKKTHKNAASYRILQGGRPTSVPHKVNMDKRKNAVTHSVHKIILCIYMPVCCFWTVRRSMFSFTLFPFGFCVRSIPPWKQYIIYNLEIYMFSLHWTRLRRYYHDILVYAPTYLTPAVNLFMIVFYQLYLRRIGRAKYIVEDLVEYFMGTVAC